MNGEKGLYFRENPEILYEVKAQGGGLKDKETLRCKGWRQETILRMLEFNMENAEIPELLVIYGGNGKCARNWESYWAIVDSLKNLEDDETLVVQSGMPVAIFKTHKEAPVVVMATTNIMQATWERFYDLQDKNLTIFAQYTAAPWEYIGTQGVIEGTFETLSAIAMKRFNDDLTGKIYLTAGAGGMGANQTWAMKMHGGVCIVVDVNEKILKKRIEKDYLDLIAPTLEDAIKLAKENAAAKKPISIGVVGNAADVYEKVLASDFRPDICSEMCPCHDPISYLPSGYTAEEADELRINDRDKYLHLARETMKIKGFVAEYIRPLFCEGRGPFRWTCLSRDPEDLKVSDDIALEICKGDKLVERWINLARKNLPIEGMPARVCYMGFGERKKFGLAINQAIKDGRIKGTVAFSRDNLDSGSIVNPTFESENMPDGGDYISDWPYLNGLLDCAAGCDLIAIQQNYSMGEAVHTGVTMIADGTEEADRRLAACLTTDSGIGVIRHAQAGYQSAKDVANGKGKFTTDSIKVPLWWQPAEKVTFGPKGKYR